MESARTQHDSLTPAQRQAVEARGNVLVMAGAGTGKTHTLIERCLDCLRRERASLDEILVVTFTEAAATELKQRLRTSLESALRSPHQGAPEQGEGGPTLDTHLAEQLALFDIASIGTLHSFCLRLVREHFYELGLDPQMTVLEPGETRLLEEETLDEQFLAHYAGQTESSVAVQNLIEIYGNGDERQIRAMILKLHHYAQTRPDAGRWLAEELTRFASPDPVEWREWLNLAIGDWRKEWIPVLNGLKLENEKAAELLTILEQEYTANNPAVTSGAAPALSSPRNVRRDAERSGPKACAALFPAGCAGAVFQKILAADGHYPARKQTKLREPLKDIFAQAAFLHSLMASESSRDPLAEDWEWVRGHMKTLLQLVQEFGRNFAERKREEGVLDFHDLEQFALQLLWNPDTDSPTGIAKRWRQKIRFIFVDEYQDINAAQDKIIQALSRDTQSNRFLVGDVKQSIYRFRLADPRIFRHYARSWNGNKGQVLPLTENFRSRETLLHFVNSVFEQLMRQEVGGIDYDTDAFLKLGGSDKHAGRRFEHADSPRAELLLRIKGNNNGSSDEDSNARDLSDLEETEKEARLVAYRISDLVIQGHKVRDESKRTERAVEWRDIAVLLRAPANKAEAYAREFERAGVPLVVERGGFYDSPEIADLLNLLKLLDNPLQDIPLIAVLRSPLVGLSLNELAQIRLSAGNVRFWTALHRAQSPKIKVESALVRKVTAFLERFSRWRRLARQVSLSRCLEAVLAETLYADWLRSRSRGPQRHANVERFMSLAQQFDQFQRQGLFRFLKFVEAQRVADAEPDVAVAAEENAVRLMTIHQSKGLEFPVVVAADLAKPFNEQDLRGEIIFDEEFGLCPRVKPPHAGQRYPSLPYWLARRHQRREQRGEELRLLYVAMTRARDTLILTATLSNKRWNEHWLEPDAITDRAIAEAKSYADWIGMWFGTQSSECGIRNAHQGALPHLLWRIVDDRELMPKMADAAEKVELQVSELDCATAEVLRKTLSWEYPFTAATERPAKSSVTALRRQGEELDDEAAHVFAGPVIKPPRPRRKLSATESGAAHHTFLQHVPLARADDPLALAAEADRLAAAGILTPDERAGLDIESVAAFWKSDTGQKIRSQPAERIGRELPFTARFSPKDLAGIIGTETPQELENEFVVVQGVADLAVLLPDEIWLLDFKTDAIRTADERQERIRTYTRQLRLYADALSRIYSRRVTNCWLHFLATRQTVRVSI